MKIKLLFVFLLISLGYFLQAQTLMPGFDAHEYANLLTVTRSASFSKADSLKSNSATFKEAYKSHEMGLKNLWWLYTNDNGQAAIVIRGTTADKESWMENYYCPMIAATGSLQLNDSTKFDYQLAERKDAYVHAGWTIGMAYLVTDMTPKIKELYAKGIKNFYIFGHSQGGVLSYLVRSYFYYQQKAGKLPDDIRFKTYTSAAPKPGNMQYAYDFDFINRDGWTYSVVNAADWVPETPYTIQRLSDMNDVNPMVDIPSSLKKAKFPLRQMGKVYFGRLNSKTKKAQKIYTNTLGHKLYKFGIKKALPQLKEPNYAPSMNYMRAGNPVVLMPDAEYYAKYGLKKENKFAHHHFAPYLYLLQKQYLNK